MNCKVRLQENFIYVPTGLSKPLTTEEGKIQALPLTKPGLLISLRIFLSPEDPI